MLLAKIQICIIETYVSRYNCTPEPFTCFGTCETLHLVDEFFSLQSPNLFTAAQVSVRDFSPHRFSNPQNLAMMPSHSALPAPTYMNRESLYSGNGASFAPSSTIGPFIPVKPAPTIPSMISVCAQPQACATNQSVVFANPPFAIKGAVPVADANVISLSPATISPSGLNVLISMGSRATTIDTGINTGRISLLHVSDQSLAQAIIRTRPQLPKNPYALMNYLLDWHASMHALLVNPVAVLNRPVCEAATKLLTLLQYLATLLGRIRTLVEKVYSQHIQAALRVERLRTVIFKALHKPLQVIPGSIRPIEAAA